MAVALVQSNAGIAATASVAPAFAGPSTSGNLVALAFAADDYNGTVDTGWTESAEMEQQSFHGGYLWWRISTGQTSFAYTIGSASNSAWTLAEFSGVDAAPYDTSQGVFTSTGASVYTSDPITPTAGNRLLLAAFGASAAGGVSTPGSFTNSFTFVNGTNTGNTATTDDAIGLAYRLVTADGSTAYTTGVTFSPNVAQSRSAMILSLKEGVTLQEFLPDADTVTTGWTATPLHSKLSDASDATVVTATLA